MSEGMQITESLFLAKIYHQYCVVCVPNSISVTMLSFEKPDENNKVIKC